ncbi:MAG TPA: 2-hydroxyacid dehydrogenase [Oscillospiraceae bacterium]|nr:2-hydroxyacid dehydrogenase [Oscillospiraceae bacterium]HPF55309.1 2-hydroxyacid dehydrogenase [Clostridiales bacterium]HPK34712.1 2-hydroxyacid dehydrogenase [Oscillospiraceae bacterium]HPR74524.1 2-hydroxyacid dehydrogenase [Oscillospiraceae bacterium]
MKKVAFFDAKPYDIKAFDEQNKTYEIRYFDSKLNPDTAPLASGCEAVIGFVNDDIGAKTIEKLYGLGVKALAMRSAGYNNVDFKAAYGKINVMRVPAYSPYAVAEHAMAMLLTLNRKIHKAYNRTRDYNYSLNGLCGTDMHGKTAGVIGTGRIGRVFIDICRGFGMNILAYDPFPAKDADFAYTDLDTLLGSADFISLHCPLTDQTHHLINKDSIDKMKNGVYIVNTSRGGLVDSEDLLAGLQAKKIGGACLDVYEEEADFFYEDHSESGVNDDTLALLSAMPNVIITSHQAYFTTEALHNIAEVTLKNLDAFFAGGELKNEICYYCDRQTNPKECRKTRKERCF